MGLHRRLTLFVDKGRQNTSMHICTCLLVPYVLAFESGLIMYTYPCTYGIDVIYYSRSGNDPAGLWIRSKILDRVIDYFVNAFVSRAPGERDRVASGVHYSWFAWTFGK